MKGFLSTKQIEYVLFHLKMHCQWDEKMDAMLHFSKNSTIDTTAPSIIFKLSAEKIDLTAILTIEDVPILYPNSKLKKNFTFENGNLIFEHDFIKSAFYLLSGFQELNHQQGDNYNRFPYKNSIQYKLNCIRKPIVNYYFEIIIEGLEKFAEKNALPFKRKRLFDSFGLLLTHDIDFIDTYTFNNLVHKGLALIGIKNSPYKNKFIDLKVFFKHLFHFFNFIHKKNPSWNFEYLRALEKKYDFKSVFYFLDKDLKYKDSFYSFHEKRMINLFKWLQAEDCEIGIHGTTRSAEDIEAMKRIIAQLEKASNTEIIGNRQHCLLYKFPQTTSIHQKTKLQYDTTLGFAAHEGFRHSYCYPFKLYNFEADKSFDFWELPLNVMDGTLFGYRKYSPKEAMKNVMALICEVKKFGGIFTLLWHNDFFDEEYIPGIKKFYEQLLKNIYEQEAQSKTGKEIIELLTIKNNS